MKTRYVAKKYTEVFKRQVVRDIERGKTTAAEVGRRYGVTGATTISRWLARYGGSRTVVKRGGRQVPVESNKISMLERRNRELEQAVASLTIEKVGLEALVEEAQAHLGVDLKKTFGTGR